MSTPPHNPQLDGDAELLSLARLLAAKEKRTTRSGRATYVERIRDLTPSASPTVEVLNALVGTQDASLVELFLLRADTAEIKAKVSAQGVLSEDPIPSEVITALAHNGVSLRPIVRKILRWGFEIGDPLYAHRATEFGLSKDDILLMLAPLTALVTNKTSAFLAHLFETSLEHSPDFFSDALIHNAINSRNAKLLTSLIYMGIQPSQETMERQGQMHPLISGILQNTQTAHQIVGLHLRYGCLAGVLSSDLPCTLDAKS